MSAGKMLGILGVLFSGAIVIGITGVIAGPPIQNAVDFFTRLLPGYIAGLSLASVAPIGFSLHEAVKRGPKWAEFAFGLPLFAQIVLGVLLLASYPF